MLASVTPQDLFRIATVSAPALSPDGTLAACVVTRIDEEQDEYRSTIWLVPTDGSAPPRPLTRGPKRDTAPTFSPDGCTLAFVRDDGSTGDDAKRPQLWAIAVTGGEAWPLTDVENGVSAAVWSPDGSTLAFLSRVTPEDGLTQDERKQRRSQARVIERLRYRLNGEGFTYDRPHAIWRVPFTRSGPSDAQRLTEGIFNDGPPAWSSDGTHLAFASARHEQCDRDHIADIWLMPAVGGAARCITRSIGPAAAPRFSLDGDQIAYLGHEHPTGGGYNTKLWLVASSGDHEPRCLTADFDHTLADGSHVWDADGRALTVRCDVEGAIHLYRIPVDGGAPRLILGGERQVSDHALKGGRLIAVSSLATTPTEMLAAAADGTEEQTLTSFNTDWIAQTVRAEPQSLRFTSADGTEVQGWLYKPFGYRDGERYPVLLNIHGGPHAQHGYGFFDEFQVLAGHGYGVLCVNYRGSSGYGERFATDINTAMGVLDYQDILAGLDALSVVSWVDVTRLGVLGGSYGGFLTSWLIAHTDRFVAACSERAVNNWLSKVGTSDIGFLQHGQMGADPWENPLLYLERSPLTYVKRISTPTLIIHSEQDLRCPIEQGEQLYTALLLQGTPTRFVRFPEENHELSRTGKPSRRLQRFTEQLAWFDRWIGLQAEGRP